MKLHLHLNNLIYNIFRVQGNEKGQSLKSILKFFDITILELI